MNNTDVLYYVVLFTPQKQKKFKTWQDGTMKYYLTNKKLVLLDEKGYNIDRLFHKGRNTPDVGDEFEFDRHIVTIESIEQATSASNATTITAAATSVPSMQTTETMPAPVNNTISQPIMPITSASNTIRNRNSNRAPGLPRKRVIHVVDHMEVDPPVQQNANRPQPPPPPPQQQQQVKPSEPQVTEPNTTPSYTIPNNLTNPTPVPVTKRFRVGLSKRPDNKLHANLHAESVNNGIKKPNTHSPRSIHSFKPPLLDQSDTSSSTNGPLFAPASTIRVQKEEEQRFNIDQSMMKPFKTPMAEGSYVPLVLQFPSKNKALNMLTQKKHPKRTKVVPMKFSNINLYQHTFQKVIHEHLEILLMNYGVYFYMTCEKFGKGKKGYDLERLVRSKGLGMYSDCDLDSGFNSERRVKLLLKNREMHSKYSKDDVWVVSKSQAFDANQTFLARSVYYGPLSNGILELDCLSARDGRVASALMKSNNQVCALRTISASTEFMMLDKMEEPMDRVPLVPFLMGSDKKGKRKQLAKDPNDLQHIKLTRLDSIDMGARLKDTIENYNLNRDQAMVLESVARSVITCPGWNETTSEPITLVHGVYGSGKSFLAAVIIIFIQGIVELACERREPEDHFTFKILITSMTNVAVDRILQTLLKLGYDQFVRIGR
ncbi:hypothetical protein K501DRAFT_333199 [Backusella circina FSU 941]|nr:hypothetical protein K501DRAFT_333199 [Backusella circina FSU 941]